MLAVNITQSISDDKFNGNFLTINAMFVKPEKYDYHVTTKDAEDWAPKIAKEI